MKSFPETWKRYLTTLGAVIAAYVVYAALAVPWIEGRRSASTAPHLIELDASRLKADLVAWLPEDAWERGSCKQISARDGHLFYREYRSFDDGRVELRPLTIVLSATAGKNPNAPPLFIRASEGAVFKLDRPLSLGGDSLQLEGGRLLGPVTMWRPPVPNGPDDQWLLHTSNIQISKQKIQTIDDVDFQIGPNHGRGRHLIIELDSDPLRAQQHTMNGVRGVARVELVQIESLHLAPPAPDSTEPPDASASESQAAASAGQKYAAGFDVACSGPFELDIATGIGTLRDDVRITATEFPQDWLTADVLEIVLGDRPPSLPGESLSPVVGASMDGLRRIAAIGRPALLSLASEGLLARGQRLAYDLQDRVVSAGGPEGIEMRWAQLRLGAREARYRLAADGTLGSGYLTGPGSLHRAEADNQPPIDVRWRDELRIQPDGDRKLLSLIGQADIVIDSTSRLAGDELRLWIWEFAAPRDAAEANAGPTWHPDRLQANTNVRIESPQLNGSFDELRAQWPFPTPDVRTSRVESRNAYVVQSQTAAQEHGPLPAGTNSGIAGSATTEPALKTNLVGRVADLRMQNGENQFQDAVVEGGVRVWQEDQAGARSFEIHGQHLQITPLQGQLYRLVVRGDADGPGRVVAQQLELGGPVVHLDQLARRLWIEGPGFLTARQLAASSPESSQMASGSSLAPGKLNVQWNGGMVFDGRQIYIESDVQMRGEQYAEEGASLLSARCTAISLSVQPPIDLAGQYSQSEAQPEIETLTLIGEVSPHQRVFGAPDSARQSSLVEIERQSFDTDGQLNSVQQLSVPWGQVHAASGKLTMNGPGSVVLWRTSETDGGLVPDRPPRAADSDLPWTNTMIRYDQSIAGNLHQTDLTFTGKVRAAHGSVADTLQILDPDKVRLVGDAMRLRSESLRVTQWRRQTEPEAHVEIMASGQAQLEGESFDAIGDRISYHQLTEKLVLEGDPRIGAELRYQSTPGGPRNPLVASKITYNLRDRTTQVDGFKRGVLTTGPILQRR